jgi:phospholipase/carboxylesterase
MKQSLDNLKVEISHLKSNYNKIIMGGFSQGSMVALELFLTSNHLFDGLFLLSSALLDYSFSSLHKSNCPIFQSHGVQDQVLKISLGRQLHNKLTPKSKVEYMEFQGGHEIPPSVLEALYIYIQKQLS